MDDSSLQERRPVRQSESTDTLGDVPDGYTVAPEPGSAPYWSHNAAQTPEDSLATPIIANTAEKGAPTKTVGRAFREILETVALAALIFFGVRLLVLNFKVDGQSMLPNLINNELLLVNRNSYGEIDLNSWLNKVPGVDREGTWVVYEFAPPEQGDIIVFNPPNGDDKPYIKRIIATEGQHVTFADDHVYVDGERLDEPYIIKPTECDGREYCDVLVPEDNVFVLGDNRTASSDSRYFGPVPIDSIIGKAIFTYWPVKEVGLVPHYDYPGDD
jgi:signal peptidase I